MILGLRNFIRIVMLTKIPSRFVWLRIIRLLEVLRRYSGRISFIEILRILRLILKGRLFCFQLLIRPNIRLWNPWRTKRFAALNRTVQPSVVATICSSETNATNSQMQLLTSLAISSTPKVQISIKEISRVQVVKISNFYNGRYFMWSNFILWRPYSSLI